MVGTEIVLEGIFPVIEDEETGWTVEVHAGDGDALTLRGRAIAATAPAVGEALVWTGTAYVPANIATQVELDAVATAAAAATATVAANLATHAARVDNPHAVTKAQVGLSLVENTALSTWAGSANLTTLGTIVTGVWNATAIAWAKVDKTGSSLADLATRSAGALNSGNLPYAQLPTGGGTWTMGGSLTFSGGTLFSSQAQALILGHTATVLVDNKNARFQLHGTSDGNAGQVFTRNSADAQGPTFIMGKSRGAVGAFDKVAAGDALGSWKLNAADDTDFRTTGAMMQAVVAASPAVATNRVPTYLAVHTSAGTADDDLTEVARFTEDGTFEVRKNTGSSSIVAAAITIRTLASGSSWLTGATNFWGSFRFWSEDTTGLGSAVRARMTAHAENAGGSLTGLAFWTSTASAISVVLTLGSDLSANFAGPIQRGGTQVVNTRRTGWTTVPTGTLTRTTFDSDTVTLPNLAARVAALIVDLHATAGHGLIGA